MTADHDEGDRNAEVVPLRATDAGTEARVEASQTAAYADLTDGTGQRKPIIPGTGAPARTFAATWA